ncbi:type II toxin-antitoxin system RelE/ParE family toxin [Rhizobium sp. 1399]|uniref:type II toxin-antitoxin system RelE/ParE family toxin n=1 Tax=Rhizobium sp. 1399 TaxID=2817758 RepID=UPI00286A0414|nr:type II toxin-antitoxin system RelE/ParE family toxin [Rhizobium sp. 1399]
MKRRKPAKSRDRNDFRVKVHPNLLRGFGRPSDFLVERNPDLAERAISGIEKALMILQDFPLRPDALPRMVRCCVVVPFGPAGYDILLKVIDEATVIVLAVGHHREEDYH